MLSKQDAHEATCRNSSDENRNRYNGMKNKANKSVSKAMRKKVEERLTELKIVQMECLD